MNKSKILRPNGHGKQHPTVTTDSGMTYYHEPPPPPQQRNHRIHHREKIFNFQKKSKKSLEPPYNEVIRNQAHMNGYNMSKLEAESSTVSF